MEKIALITGASRGIGKEIAKTLAAKGATVVVNYNGSAAKAEETVKEIEALGGKAEALQCNVSEYDKAAEMMEYVVKTYGRVDILVNNAGISAREPLADYSPEAFRSIMDLNVTAVFHGCKAVEPIMRADGGKALREQSAYRDADEQRAVRLLGDKGQSDGDDGGHQCPERTVHAVGGCAVLNSQSADTQQRGGGHDQQGRPQ